MPDGGRPRLPDGLPPGRWVSPDPAFAEGIAVTEPALWVSDHPIPDAGSRWGRLLAAQPGTGLWPLLLTGLPRHPDRPWPHADGWARPTTRALRTSRSPSARGRNASEPAGNAKDLESEAVAVADTHGPFGGQRFLMLCMRLVCAAAKCTDAERSGWPTVRARTIPFRRCFFSLSGHRRWARCPSGGAPAHGRMGVTLGKQG
jgi:hypothetical protein